MRYTVYCFFLFITCTTFAQQTANYRTKYDDSTLQLKSPLTLMPFNRLVQSAGKVVTFGDPRQENHALDFAVLPGEKYMVVEDRYGVAVIDIATKQIKSRWAYQGDKQFGGLMSTYSGIKSFSYNDRKYIVWGAGSGRKCAIMIAEWNESYVTNVSGITVNPIAPAAAALPNEVAVTFEAGVPYLYVVLNGNNQLLKIRFTDRQVVWSAPTGVAPYGLRVIGNKAYVTNWAGPLVTDTTLENAGVPWGSAYTNPVTGGTLKGTLSVIDIQSGKLINELALGQHPNAIVSSPDNKYLYIANGNSDFVSVVDVENEKVTGTIDVGLFKGAVTYYGSSPNALVTNASGTTLYVTNGFDNAVCVVKLGKNDATKGTGASSIVGYMPTEAYPGGIALLNNTLYVANIEAKGSRVLTPVKSLDEDDKRKGDTTSTNAYSIHQELASVSIIPVPAETELKAYTEKVKHQSLFFRIALTNAAARKNITPKPLPERIGEPSVFKHVVYIVKENKTYDQVFGDVAQGRGEPKLCIFGDSVTPNQHKLVNSFSLLDNYYASGKSSAEGHQWAGSAMVTDYIEKSVRAWFRSYPHRQEDALVYSKTGYIWNNALDHGKKVRIYGEACLTHYDESLKWLDIYNNYLNHKPMDFTNTTTIARIRPIISPSYPDNDNLVITDQIRADVFIQEWKQYEAGDSLPDLMVLSLPDDHTAGTSPNSPVPKAMVADNDLAVGRIVDMISHSRYWDSTVIFVTEDDSQSGWDHISSYRTTGIVISPYSVFQTPIHTNYNQTSMVRTIEQILGIPPLNIMDATALPMFDCFNSAKTKSAYTYVPNIIPLNRMNKSLADLKGTASHYAKLSANSAFKEVDGGDDDMMNRILWFDAKGNVKYPSSNTSNK